MVKRLNQRGQSATELLVVMSVLTAVGILMLNLLTNQGSDAVGNLQTNAIQAIQNE